jgi:glycosyltransferase involved in cell wall biosynthesis
MGADLVVPVYNEEDELPGFLDNMLEQTDDVGRPLRPGSLRVIVVDNGSTDRTREVLESYAASPLRLVILDEPIKSHIQARIRGATAVMNDTGIRQYPILVNADVDTRFDRRWIFDITRRLVADAPVDVLSYAGFFPDAFWRRAPRLARRYMEEVGTIFFSDTVIDGFGFARDQALFSEELFERLGRMPSDCGFALRKSAYAAAGGYRREYDQSGREILGEGWNLRFRLDRVGARSAFAARPWYQTSPRRLLHDAARMLRGDAYQGGMSDHRGAPAHRQYEDVERLAEHYDFEQLRRYVLKNYIVLPCLSSNVTLERAVSWLGASVDGLWRDIRAAVVAEPRPAAATLYQMADRLTAPHAESLLAAVRRVSVRR